MLLYRTPSSWIEDVIRIREHQAPMKNSLCGFSIDKDRKEAEILDEYRTFEVLGIRINSLSYHKYLDMYPNPFSVYKEKSLCRRSQEMIGEALYAHMSQGVSLLGYPELDDIPYRKMSTLVTRIDNNTSSERNVRVDFLEKLGTEGDTIAIKDQLVKAVDMNHPFGLDQVEPLPSETKELWRRVSDDIARLFFTFYRYGKLIYYSNYQEICYHSITSETDKEIAEKMKSSISVIKRAKSRILKKAFALTGRRFTELKPLGKFLLEYGVQLAKKRDHSRDNS